MPGLSAVDAVTLGAYLVGLFAVAVRVRRRARARGEEAAEAYFSAGHAVEWWAVGASVFASNIGSEHLVGLTGSAARYGLVVAVYELGAVPVVLLVGLLFLPTYLGARVQTAPDYLERRYSKRCRMQVVLLSLMLYIFSKVSATLYSGQLLITQLAPQVSEVAAVALLVALTASYVVVGGLEAVIYTETAQAAVLVLGGLLVAGFSLAAVGGLAGLREGVAAMQASAETPLPADYLLVVRAHDDPDFPFPAVLFGYYAISPWYWGCDQVIVQRVLAARDVAHGQLGCVAAALLKFLPMLIMVVPGLCARVLVARGGGSGFEGGSVGGSAGGAGLANASQPFQFDTAYPWLVLNVVPRNARGVIAASMLASLMSALASVFNSAASLVALNLWRERKPAASERELVLVGRVAVVLVAAVSLLWLPVIPRLGDSLFVLMQKPPAYVAPPVLSLYLWGMISRRPTARAAELVLSAGLAAGGARFVLEVAEELGAKQNRFGLFTSLNFLAFAAASFWCCSGALFALSWLMPRCGAASVDPADEAARSRLVFRWALFEELLGESHRLKPEHEPRRAIDQDDSEAEQLEEEAPSQGLAVELPPLGGAGLARRHPSSTSREPEAAGQAGFTQIALHDDPPTPLQQQHQQHDSPEVHDREGECVAGADDESGAAVPLRPAYGCFYSRRTIHLLMGAVMLLWVLQVALVVR
jgi:SSS family transporter